MSHARDALDAAALILAFRVLVALLFLAGVVCILLGKISFLVGAGGLGAVIAVELTASVINKRRLDKAMREAERDLQYPPDNSH